MKKITYLEINDSSVQVEIDALHVVEVPRRDLPDVDRLVEEAVLLPLDHLARRVRPVHLGVVAVLPAELPLDLACHVERALALLLLFLLLLLLRFLVLRPLVLGCYSVM